MRSGYENPAARLQLRILRAFGTTNSAERLEILANVGSWERPEGTKELVLEAFGSPGADVPPAAGSLD